MSESVDAAWAVDVARAHVRDTVPADVAALKWRVESAYTQPLAAMGIVIVHCICEDEDYAHRSVTLEIDRASRCVTSELTYDEDVEVARSDVLTEQMLRDAKDIREGTASLADGVQTDAALPTSSDGGAGGTAAAADAGADAVMSRLGQLDAEIEAMTLSVSDAALAQARAQLARELDTELGTSQPAASSAAAARAAPS